MSKYQVIVLVLVAAIVVVAAVAASLVFLQDRAYRDAASRARRNAASVQLQAFKAPLAMYRLDVGKYPSTLDELRNRPLNTPKWDGPYLNQEIPSDPWGNPYQYRLSGDKIDLWSFGPDGKNGTPDDIRLEDAARPE